MHHVRGEFALGSANLHARNWKWVGEGKDATFLKQGFHRDGGGLINEPALRQQREERDHRERRQIEPGIIRWVLIPDYSFLRSVRSHVTLLVVALGICPWQYLCLLVGVPDPQALSPRVAQAGLPQHRCDVLEAETHD